MREHNSQHSWKDRVQEMLQSCHTEIRRTTAIGIKMINASKANSELQEHYKCLGKLVIKAIKNGDLDWKDPQVRVLMSQVDELEQALNEYEDQVQDLKKD